VFTLHNLREIAIRIADDNEWAWAVSVIHN